MHGYLNDIKVEYEDKENNNIKLELTEYKNGKAVGILYYCGDIRYKGEFLYLKKNGKGKEYWTKKLKYEGDFLKDKKFGKGKQ